MHRRTAEALAAGMLCLAADAALAQSPPAYYASKELRILVGYAPGGGYDTYARAVAQVLDRHLPGKPTVLVQNMPGADGLTLSNHMAQRAPRDGTVIAITNRNLAAAPALGLIDKASVQYDPAQFFWIANMNVDVSVVVVRKDAGVRSLEDLKAREIVVGATGLTSNNAVYPYVVNNLVGTRLKVVTGYPGSSHITLAVERGELQGNGGWAWSSVKVQKPEWIASGFIVPLVQLGTSKVPELPNVPFLIDLARSAEERLALELVFAPDAMGRPFFAPPEIPAAAGDLLRKAFAALVKDREFIAIADKARLDVTFEDGGTVEALVRRLATAPAATQALARQLMQPGKTAIEELGKR